MGESFEVAQRVKMSVELADEIHCQQRVTGPASSDPKQAMRDALDEFLQAHPDVQRVQIEVIAHAFDPTQMRAIVSPV